MAMILYGVTLVEEEIVRFLGALVHTSSELG